MDKTNESSRLAEWWFLAEQDKLPDCALIVMMMVMNDDDECDDAHLHGPHTYRLVLPNDLATNLLCRGACVQLDRINLTYAWP